VSLAQQLTVDINRVSDAGVGDKIGTVQVFEARAGVSSKVAVNGIPQGQRGFHRALPGRIIKRGPIYYD
jgi:Cu/Zn superoxide dismutase